MNKPPKEFTDALNRPKSRKIGWKYADEDSLLAAACQAIVDSGAFGLNASMMYVDAKQRGLTFRDIHIDDMELCQDLMWEGIEVNEDYFKIANKRISKHNHKRLPLT